VPSHFSVVSSLTLYWSQYRKDSHSSYIASAWDNRLVLNLLGTYNLPRNWSIGSKLSAIGGAPYTPYDISKSSLVKAWDVRGRPYYDYSQYNERRLKMYAQLDLRVDKMYYFHRWMLGFYFDVQNATKSKFREQDIPMSTGIVANPQDDSSVQRYQMKYIRQVTGALIPTIGATIQF
jgi:hypothetical protein